MSVQISSLTDALKPEAPVNGEYLARTYKYYRQFCISYQRRIIPLNRISATGLYKNHKRVFDKLAEVFNRRGLDATVYIKFFAYTLGKTEYDIDAHILSTTSISAFIAHRSMLEKYRKIIEWFEKSVMNLAEFCVDENTDAFNGFRLLLNRKILASWYLSGKLSKYYLSAIPNFGKSISKLDHFSKLELRDLSEKYDVYNTEVNAAFLHYKNIKANPLRAVDKMIVNLKNK